MGGDHYLLPWFYCCLVLSRQCRELQGTCPISILRPILQAAIKIHIPARNRPGAGFLAPCARRARSHRARSELPLWPYPARISGESLGRRLCSPLGNGISEPKFLFLFFGLAEKCFSRNSLIPLSPHAGRSGGPAREAALGRAGGDQDGAGRGQGLGAAQGVLHGHQQQCLCFRQRSDPHQCRS